MAKHASDGDVPSPKCQMRELIDELCTRLDDPTAGNAQYGKLSRQLTKLVERSPDADPALVAEARAQFARCDERDEAELVAELDKHTRKRQAMAEKARVAREAFALEAKRAVLQEREERVARMHTLIVGINRRVHRSPSKAAMEMLTYAADELALLDDRVDSLIICLEATADERAVHALARDAIAAVETLEANANDAPPSP